MQVTQGGSLMVLLRFLEIVPLLDSLMSYLKGGCFSMWYQTRSSLSSRPRRSLVGHSLSISYLVILAPIAFQYTSSRLVGILDGLSVRVRRSSPVSRILYWPKIWVSQVSPQRSSFVRSSRVVNLGGSYPFLLGIFSP